LPNVYAQKSSGTLDNDEIKSYTQNVESIDDAVTKSASTAGDAVRFLLRPIREADISPNMTGTVSKIHYDVGQRFKNKSSLDEQKALLTAAEIDRRNCKVVAPFSGGVISKDVQAFEAVTPSIIVMSIIDNSGLVMSLNVPSSFVNRVKTEDTFTVVVDETGKTYAAKVVGVSPAIDPVSKTIELRAEVTEGLDELVAGMSGRANMDFSR